MYVDGGGNVFCGNRKNVMGLASVGEGETPEDHKLCDKFPYSDACLTTDK